MPTILLIRHGQASFGTDEYDRLSELGVRQSRVIAEALDGRHPHVERILTGSLRRQRDTAVPLAGRRNLVPITDARWNEYAMDEIIAAHAPDADVSTVPGELTSAAFQDILEASMRGWMSAGAATAALESWPAFTARVEAGLAGLANDLGRGETAVVFSSGGVIATVCAHLLGLDGDGLLALNRVSVNTAVTKLAIGRRGRSLVSFNDHGHLEPEDLITYR